MIQLKMLAVGLRRVEMNQNGSEVENITQGNQTDLSVEMDIPDLTEEDPQTADILRIVVLTAVIALLLQMTVVDLTVPIGPPDLLVEHPAIPVAIIVGPLHHLIIAVPVSPGDPDLVLLRGPVGTSY
jgi:hypothetical protein